MNWSFYALIFICSMCLSYMIACGSTDPETLVRKPAQTEVIYSKDDPCAKLHEQTGTVERNADDGEQPDRNADDTQDESSRSFDD